MRWEDKLEEVQSIAEAAEGSNKMKKVQAYVNDPRQNLRDNKKKLLHETGYDEKEGEQKWVYPSKSSTRCRQTHSIQ